MTPRALVLLSIVLLAASGCSTPSPEATRPTTGREVVDRMIEAHGGLEKWRSAPTVSFQAALVPPGASSPLVHRVTVEQGARRAYLDFPGMGARISWDGEKAWSENWKGPFPPRFVALLSYYFMNLPWVAADPGVNLSQPGTDRLWDDPTEYVTVKMTFEAGVGDTPDDYYILHMDPESYRLRAAELTVSYADALPPDVDMIREVIGYEEFATVDGLTVPTKCSIYAMDRSPLASFPKVWDWSFQQAFDESRMVMPADAVLDTSSARRAAKKPE